MSGNIADTRPMPFLSSNPHKYINVKFVRFFCEVNSKKWSCSLNFLTLHDETLLLFSQQSRKHGTLLESDVTNLMVVTRFYSQLAM